LTVIYVYCADLAGKALPEGNNSPVPAGNSGKQNSMPELKSTSINANLRLIVFKFFFVSFVPSW
jgi:hypothetical protein